MTEARKPGEARPDLIIDPLDYLILDLLPIEGTLHFGAYPVGLAAYEIQPKLAEGQVKITTISSRLRVMGAEGWVVKQKGIGTSGKHVWQRTAAGDKALHKWKGEGNGGS